LQYRQFLCEGERKRVREREKEIEKERKKEREREKDLLAPKNIKSVAVVSLLSS
jgi:hypothetical protein